MSEAKYVHFYYRTQYLFTAKSYEVQQVFEKLSSEFRRAGYLWDDSGDIVPSNEKTPQQINPSYAARPLSYRPVTNELVAAHLEHDLYAPYRQESVLKRMHAENNRYLEKIAQLPFKEILNHAYEIAMRADILFAVENMDLTVSPNSYLLKSDHPLQDIFEEYQKRPAEYMEVIRSSVEVIAKKGQSAPEKAEDRLNALLSQAQKNLQPGGIPQKSISQSTPKRTR